MSVISALSADDLISLNNELLFNIANEFPVENFVFSPLFSKMALALLYQGAAGLTEDELNKVLRVGHKTRLQIMEDFKNILVKVKIDAVRFFPHTSIFVDNELKITQKFKDLAKNYFATPVIPVKFENSADASEIVNRWLEEQSRKKLQNFYIKSNFAADTKALMVSMVYFKGKWAKPFDLEKTKPVDFKLSKAKSEEVDMMYLFAKLRYGEVKTLNARILELPFEDSEISMLILLPTTIDGLNSMEQNLLDLDFHKEWRKLTLHDVRVQLPKFNYIFHFSLKTTLFDMGLQSLFSMDSDMRNLLETQEEQEDEEEQGQPKEKYQKMPFVDIKHIGIIEIDEYGSRITGETISKQKTENVIRRLSENHIIYDFIVDHPFFFVIRDTNHIYFTGHLTKTQIDHRMSEST